MSKLNLCWPDRHQCHTYLCDRRPTLQECPLSKGSPPSVIESTWVPCIQKAPFNCRDENVKPHSIQPRAPNPAPAPDLKVAQQVTEESEATYTIAGQEITETNALIGIGVVGALSFALVM